MTGALMEDFPPAPARLVTLANWRQAPFSAWSFRNVRRLLPTANIAASGRTTALELALEEIGHIGFSLVHVERVREPRSLFGEH